MDNDHDRVVVLETTIHHIRNTVDRIEDKLDTFNESLSKKMSYKVFGIILTVIGMTAAAVFAVASIVR